MNHSDDNNNQILNSYLNEYDDNAENEQLINSLIQFENTENEQLINIANRIENDRAVVNNVIITLNEQINELLVVSETQQAESTQRGGQLAYVKTKDKSKNINKYFGFEERNIEYTSVTGNITSYESIIRSLLEFIENFVENEIRTIDENKIIRLIIDHDSFDGAINTNFMNVSEISSEFIWQLFSDTVQSRKTRFEVELTPEQKMKITIQTVETVMGGALKKITKKSIAEPKRIKQPSKRQPSKLNWEKQNRENKIKK